MDHNYDILFLSAIGLVAALGGGYIATRPVQLTGQEKLERELLEQLKRLNALIQSNVLPSVETQSNIPEIDGCSFSENRQAVQRATVCGCGHCLAIFLPMQISAWMDDGKTALCPVCTHACVAVGSPDVPLTAMTLLRIYGRGRDRER